MTRIAQQPALPTKLEEGHRSEPLSVRFWLSAYGADDQIRTGDPNLGKVLGFVRLVLLRTDSVRCVRFECCPVRLSPPCQQSALLSQPRRCGLPGPASKPMIKALAESLEVIDSHRFTYYNKMTSIHITASAGKHGVNNDDILHAIDNAIIDTYEIPPDFDPPRFLIVGPNQSGALLELVGVETDEGDDLIFHAMSLRPVFNHLLPPDLRVPT